MGLQAFFKESSRVNKGRDPGRGSESGRNRAQGRQRRAGCGDSSRLWPENRPERVDCMAAADGDGPVLLSQNWPLSVR